MNSKRVLDQMGVGEVLQIITDHGPAVQNLPASHAGRGHTVLRVAQLNDTDWEVVVQKGR